MSNRNITLSVVSHRQNALVNALLEDIDRVCSGRVSLIVTENMPDSDPLQTNSLGGPVKVVRNAARKGYGANHNAAFRSCRTPWFCVCNPDIRLPGDPFEPLLESLDSPQIGVVGPLVCSPTGNVEDSARRFPTLASLTTKLFTSPKGPDYPSDRGPLDVDWIAGMFMLFRSDTFRALGGFDEAFFLYYEDVDLCLRMRRAGYRVLYDPRAQVVHDARRASRRDPRLAMHHIASILRYLSRI